MMLPNEGDVRIDEQEIMRGNIKERENKENKRKKKRRRSGLDVVWCVI